MDLVPVVIAAAVPILIGGVRWAVTSAIDARIGQQVNDIEKKVEELAEWAADHRRDHDALIGALSRQGIQPPDGWQPSVVEGGGGR